MHGELSCRCHCVWRPRRQKQQSCTALTQLSGFPIRRGSRSRTKSLLPRQKNGYMKTKPQPSIDRDETLFRHIYETGKGFYVAFGILLIVFLWALYMYVTQVWFGLGLTGMNQPVTWGFYIVNFVFFIGISHAGTLISAILRLSKAEWRRPITRMAEVITVMVLFIGAGQILVDLGRPDRLLNVIRYGRYQSPLLWDATSISAYLTASTFYLYLPLIPDIAILPARIGKRRV